MAELDNSVSQSMFVRGNEDRWLSPREVEVAVGLQPSIRRTFDDMRAYVANTRAPSIPAAKMYELLAARSFTETERTEGLPKNIRFEERPFDVGSRASIPEIMSLTDGANVPKDLVKKYDATKVAESIVARLGKTMKVPKHAKPDWCLFPLREVRFDPTQPRMVQQGSRPCAFQSLAAAQPRQEGQRQEGFKGQTGDLPGRQTYRRCLRAGKCGYSPLKRSTAGLRLP